MKVIFRADDYGLSEGVNRGIIDSVNDGVITAFGIIVNAAHVIDGVKLLKTINKKNISIGMHFNITVGKPVSDPKLLPSLIDPSTGMFYRSSVHKTRVVDTIATSEIEIEVRAQLNEFIRLTGKKPDYIDNHVVTTMNNLNGVRKVCESENIVYFHSVPNTDIGNGLVMCDLPYTPEVYDVMNVIKNTIGFIRDNKDKKPYLFFHPAYIDDRDELSKYTSMIDARFAELKVLTSNELKQWLLDNDIELTTP